MIVDIHNHITTKPMFVHEANRTIEEPYNFLMGVPLIDKFGGDIIDSQTSIRQLEEGDVRVIVNPLYTLERCLGRVKSIYGTLADLTSVDEAIVRGLADGGVVPYTHTLAEFELLNSSARVNILRRNGQIDPNRINVMSSLEGLQGLFLTEEEFRGQINIDTFIRRLEHFIGEVSPIYVTSAHVCFTSFFRFAYGVKMVKENQQSWFLPRDISSTGLNNNALAVINTLWENNVLVDAKHMSLGNRMALYAYALQNNKPVIVSHGAVTGIRVKDYFSFYSEGAYKKDSFKVAKPFNQYYPDQYQSCRLLIPRGKGVFDREFNSSQINLMDEDIIFILKTGGIIGLIMDRRIMGNIKFKELQNNRQIDFIAQEDLDWLFENLDELLEGQGLNDYKIGITQEERGAIVSKWSKQEAEETDETRESRDQKELGDIERFCQSLIHIIDVGYKNGIRTADKQISIGSDFDGLIDPMIGHRDAGQFTTFKDKVLAKLRIYNSRPDSILRQWNIDPDTLVEDVFSRNTLAFLRDRFSIT